MTNIVKYIREKNLIVVLTLLVIGLILLLGSTYFTPSSKTYVLIIKLGATFIVTAIAIFLLSRAVGGIEKIFGERIDKLISKLDILSEAKRCGIVHIFESRRREDPSYKEELIKQFEACEGKEEVLLMGISFRDFFGSRLDIDYLNAIRAMFNKDIRINILLLDPTSEAARDRAIVEEKERVERHGYICSTLFTTIKIVAERLNDPSHAGWVIDEDLERGIRELTQVRFFPYDPTTHLIITDRFTFIEQYHRGGDDEIRRALERRGVPSIDCFGGFFPVWMSENSSFHARLMRSHFTNIWISDAVRERDLRENNYYQRILEFEERERIALAS